MVVAGVTIDDVEVLNLVEVVLGGISGVNTGDPRVEAATKDGRQSGLLEALLVSPLPAVFEVSLVLGVRSWPYPGS